MDIALPHILMLRIQRVRTATIGVLAAAGAAGAIVVGGHYFNPGTGGVTLPPIPGSHNIWIVPSSVGLCRRVALVETVTQAINNGDTCSSARLANNISLGGDSIGWAAGQFPAQTITTPNVTRTQMVLVVPEGGTVNFTGQFCIGNTASSSCDGSAGAPGYWLTIDACGGSGTFTYQWGISINARPSLGAYPHDIIFSCGHTETFTSSSATNIIQEFMQNGPVCCDSDTNNPTTVGLAGGTGIQPNNIQLIGNHIYGATLLCADMPTIGADGVGSVFNPGSAGIVHNVCHDSTDSTWCGVHGGGAAPCAAIHVDAIQYYGGNNVSTLYNLIDGYSEQGAFFGGNKQGTDTTCTNPTAQACYSGTWNFIGNAVANCIRVTCGRAFALGDTVTSTKFVWGPGSVFNFKYNTGISFDSALGQSSTPPGTVNWVGNLGGVSAGFNCALQAGTIYNFSYNHLTGKVCTGTANQLITSLTTEIVDPSAATFDPHLLITSTCINAGNVADFPTTDFYRNTRYVGTAPDCGAVESSFTPGTGGTGLTTGISAAVPLVEGGNTRYFKTYIPSAGLTCPSTGCPVVMLLGGSVSTGVNQCNTKTSYLAMTDCDIGSAITGSVSPGGPCGQMCQSNWPAQADAQNFVLVEPEMAALSCQNGGGCGSPEASPTKTFFQDIITYIGAHANINTNKVYLTGFSAGASQVLAVACNENGLGSPAAKFTFSDWTGAANMFAGFAVMAGAMGGNAPSQTPVNACVWPTIAKPTLYMTSKNDQTIQTDDANSSHTNQQCDHLTGGVTCQLNASTIYGLYITQYGCTGPTITHPSDSAYTSDDKYVWGCSPPAAYEYWSRGSGPSNGPLHSYQQYQSGLDFPTVAWTFWSNH